ncbi:hypothetical protein TNCV_3407161 [Trichonephila clavipes]|nr:hypothetical protein TNCV_3407161 [Trichonephila clavipes]
MIIHRRLIARSLSSYLRQLPLTPANCRARLQWQLARTGWNHEYWGRIVFSDESRFQLCPDNCRGRVRAAHRSCFHYCTPHRLSTRRYGLGCHFS